MKPRRSVRTRKRRVAAAAGGGLPGGAGGEGGERQPREPAVRPPRRATPARGRGWRRLRTAQRRRKRGGGTGAAGAPVAPYDHDAGAAPAGRDGWCPARVYAVGLAALPGRERPDRGALEIAPVPNQGAAPLQPVAPGSGTGGCCPHLAPKPRSATREPVLTNGHRNRGERGLLGSRPAGARAVPEPDGGQGRALTPKLRDRAVNPSSIVPAIYGRGRSEEHDAPRGERSPGSAYAEAGDVGGARRGRGQRAAGVDDGAGQRGHPGVVDAGVRLDEHGTVGRLQPRVVEGDRLESEGAAARQVRVRRELGHVRVVVGHLGAVLEQGLHQALGG